MPPDSLCAPLAPVTHPSRSSPFIQLSSTVQLLKTKPWEHAWSLLGWQTVRQREEGRERNFSSPKQNHTRLLSDFKLWLFKMPTTTIGRPLPVPRCQTSGLLSAAARVGKRTPNSLREGECLVWSKRPRASRPQVFGWASHTGRPGCTAITLLHVNGATGSSSRNVLQIEPSCSLGRWGKKAAPSWEDTKWIKFSWRQHWCS